MAIRAAQLMVEIGADISKLNSGLNQSQTALDKFAKSTLVAGSALTALITAPSLLAGRAMMNVSLAFEQTEVAFRKMLGSGEKAKKFLDDLKNFAAATPFEFSELQEASKRMLAYGFAAERVLPMLRDIGDASAGLGAGSDGVNRITLALGQMQGKAKVSAQEMMQLTEVGIPAWKYLANAMGLSTQEVMKMSEQGLIPASQAIEAILDGMRQNFGGMMAEQAKTAGGQISNLKDDLYGLAVDMGMMLLPTVKDLVGYARDVAGWLRGLSPEMQKNIIGFVGLAAAAGPAFVGLASVVSAVQTLTVISGPVIGAVRSLGAAFALMQGASTVGGALSVAGAGLAGITAVALPAAAAIGAVAVAWDHFITKTNEAGREAVASTWTKFFNDQVSAGKGAAEVLAEYQAAQERVNAELEKAGILKIFMGDTEQLKGDVEGLNQALLITSTSYSEYLELIQQSGEPITAATQAEWEMAHAVEQMGIASQSAAIDGFAQVLSGAERTKEQLEGLIGVVDSISGEMKEWTAGAASSMVSALQNRLPEGSQKFADALGIVDEVMQTSYLGQMRFNDSVKSLVDQYARTGDLSAFRDGLIDIKEKGLADMQKSLEDATTKAQGLYEQLLALPEDIRIKINLDIDKLPGWLTEKMSKTASETSYKAEALGGPVWANQPYIVGERGRELFVSTVNGRIESNPGKGIMFRNYGTVIVGQDSGFGAELLAALN